jgi:hypothetical protein
LAQRLFPNNSLMTDSYSFRLHGEGPQLCSEEWCERPVYDGARCKLHADLDAYRKANSLDTA